MGGLRPPLSPTKQLDAMKKCLFFVLCIAFGGATLAQTDQIKTLVIQALPPDCEAFVRSPMRLNQGSRISTSAALPENFWTNPLLEGKLIHLKTTENVVVNGENLVRKGAQASGQIKKIEYVEKGLNRGEIASIQIEIVKVTACDCSAVKLDGFQKLTPGTREISILSRVSESKIINTSR